MTNMNRFELIKSLNQNYKTIQAYESKKDARKLFLLNFVVIALMLFGFFVKEYQFIPAGLLAIVGITIECAGRGLFKNVSWEDCMVAYKNSEEIISIYKKHLEQRAKNENCDFSALMSGFSTNHHSKISYTKTLLECGL